MKKILMSVFAIAAMAAIAGVGSFALWSDTEGSLANSITADYLDLTVSGVPITIENVMPGQTGSSVLFVKNNSETVYANLTFAMANLVNAENGCPEAESNEGEDTSCSNPGNGEGELDENVTVSVMVASVNGGVADTYVPVTGFTSMTLADFVAADLSGLALPMDPGQEMAVKVDWTVNNSATPFADNIFMTDSVKADFTATLTQMNPQP
jgi:hypothetical protein